MKNFEKTRPLPVATVKATNRVKDNPWAKLDFNPSQKPKVQDRVRIIPVKIRKKSKS